MSGPFFADETPAHYPDVAGAKRRDTSFAAAAAIEPTAKSLRERVLRSIAGQAGTPEEIAKRLGVPVMNVRPRCSELAAKNLIVDSGRRRVAMGGRKAIVWQVAQ